ncbi:MAG: YceD family protein [Bifidobacteriaceae bacterium]|jgi:uncharacterized protein|nr:YceD family protein [Bifidobacteriaceae bacterium]
MPEKTAAAAPELTVSVKQFGRQPGTSKQLSIEFAAPADLATGVVGVGAGSPAHLDLLLEAVLEGILATGTVRARAAGECARCLAVLDLPVVATFQELFVYPEREAAARQAGQPAADEQPAVVQDRLDLNPQVRDAVVLALPFTPLCRDDCPGLCPQCGADLADEPGHAHRAVDARWAVLEDLLEDEREEM